jgi:hypothetical protein
MSLFLIMKLNFKRRRFTISPISPKQTIMLLLLMIPQFLFQLQENFRIFNLISEAKEILSYTLC